MSDVFSNLTAQSLSSSVGIQPLLPPLFSPAPKLPFEATLPTPNEQSAVAAEHATDSITPSNAADGMIGTSEMGQPSKEVVSTENRTVVPDLVPLDVSPNAISVSSLRHLLYYQRLKYDGMEPVTHLSQASAPAPTIDESSSEDTFSSTVLHVDSVRDDVSRPSPKYQLPRKVDVAPLPQSIRSQESTLPNTGNSEMPYSSIHHDDQMRTEENVIQLHATSTNYEPQHTSQKGYPAIPTDDASHFQYPSPPSDKPAVPLQIQPALPDPLPSLQAEAHSEYIMDGDEVLHLDQAPSSLVQPQVQSASTPVRIRRDGFIAPLDEVSATIYHASKPRLQTTTDGQPRIQREAASQALSGLDETTIKPLLDQQTVAKEPKLLQPSQAAESTNISHSVRARFIEPSASAEPISNSSVPHPSNIQDAQSSPRDYSIEEAYNGKMEGDVPPIHITIGRVVVRATPTSQPTPIQKHVLRPAQSLNAYLKQRERGNR